MYQSPDKNSWKGRNDPGQTSEDFLWHHVIQLLDLNNPIFPATQEVAFLGFVSDEGVRRNQGRVGAVQGPDALRKAMSNLAVHFPTEIPFIYDAGNVITTQGHLEEAQNELAGKVKTLLDHGYLPILLGGGHEIAYGHFSGIRNSLPNEQQIGIINFDAHLDMREYPRGAHSGSSFHQILDDCRNRGETFHYFPIGINKAANTRRMFDLMEHEKQSFITLEEMRMEALSELAERLASFMQKVDHVFVTIDLDVFPAAFAPGVSAPAPVGVFPHLVKDLMQFILHSGKMISIDLAELNPTYDDGRTAKLGASFIYDVVMSRIH